MERIPENRRTLPAINKHAGLQANSVIDRDTASRLNSPLATRQYTYDWFGPRQVSHYTAMNQINVVMEVASAFRDQHGGIAASM